MSKVMLITGASRGIGAATARRAAAQGYALCLNYHRQQAAAEALVSEITQAGGQAIAVQADVADEDQVMQLVASMCWSTMPASWKPRCACSKWT